MTEGELRADFITIEKAIRWAEKRGFITPPLEKAIFMGVSNHGVSNSIRIWAIGLLTTPAFAETFFGDTPVDQYGNELIILQIWAKQVGVEHEGKYYDVPSDRREVYFMKHNKVELFREAEVTTPIYLDEPERATKQLQDRYSALAVNTHRIKGVEVTGGCPSWKHHLKEMITCDNPIVYLEQFMNEKINHKSY